MLNISGIKIKEFKGGEIWTVGNFIMFGDTVFAKNNKGLNKIFKLQDIFESYNLKSYDNDGVLLV